MSGDLGIGFVGAGRFAVFCIAAFEGLPDARVVAVMDPDRSRAEAIAPPGAKTYAELQALLDDPVVDIVHVATPPYLHGRITEQAAERGKHVFVEKPLATSLEDARAALAAAERAGVRVSIDYVLRHHPLHRLAIEVTRSEALGGLQHFALENFASSESLPPEHWFWDPTLSGGIHVEHGVHFFDLCLALSGREPDQVSGATQVRPDGLADRVSALLRFGDAMVATFYHSFNRTGATERTTIRLGFEHGRDDRRLDPDPPRDRGNGGTRTTRETSNAARRRLVAERPHRQDDYRLAIRAGMANLVGAIVRNEPLEVTAKDGLRSLEIALRAS